MQKFIGGIGCFWDETKYEGITGVISTECGYCGGKSPMVSYEQVCGGNTEHIEVVKVEFDPKIISYEDLTRLFFKFNDKYKSKYQNDQKPKPPRRHMHDIKCSIFFTYGCFDKNNQRI